MSADDDPRSKRPSTSKVNEIVRPNRRLTFREILYDYISVGSCYEILIEKLGMHRVAARFVPQLMSQDQKNNRVTTTCQELLDNTINDKIFTKRVIMTLRQKSNHSGSADCHQDQKKFIGSVQNLGIMHHERRPNSRPMV